MHLEFDNSPTPPVPSRTIVLIGLRGSGKTTVGKRLAGRLGLPFIDLDTRTPRFAGEATVADVFAKRGEAAFRIAEVRALEASLKEPACVIACGGGTPTAPGATELLRYERASSDLCIVYLRADPATLRARLESADNASRPSLTNKGLLDEIPELWARRDPAYRALASHVVEVASSDADRIAAFLAAKLG